MTLSSAEAFAIGIALELAIWGVYAVIFSSALKYLTWRRRSPAIHKFLLFATILLFSCCTVHAWTQFVTLYEFFFTQVDDPKFVLHDSLAEAEDVLVNIIDFFGACVLSYRVWLVWGKSYLVVLLPLLLTISSLVTFAVAFSMALDPNLSDQGAIIFQNLLTASFALSAVFNIVATILVVYPIWIHYQEAKPILYSSEKSPSGTLRNTSTSSTNKLVQVMGWFVETGALFLVVQVTVLILWTRESVGISIGTSIAVQIYGLAPTLIIVRVGKGHASEQTAKKHITSPVVFGNVPSTTLNFTRSNGSGGMSEV